MLYYLLDLLTEWWRLLKKGLSEKHFGFLWLEKAAILGKMFFIPMSSNEPIIL